MSAATGSGPGRAGVGDRLRRAAAEHLEAKGPLREWSDALAETAEAHVARMEEAAAEMRAAMEKRAASLELARDGADAAAETARLAVAELKLRTEHAAADLIDGLKAEIGAGVKDYLVIKERLHGAKRIGLVAGLGALAAAALFGGGYGLRAWRDAEAVGFHAACAREVVHDARGNAYCVLRAVLTDEGSGT